jgi:hypothetical protein
MTVLRMHDHVLECRLIDGTFSGTKVLIPRIKLTVTGDVLPFNFSRHQFPLRPAFAMTINKARRSTGSASVSSGPSSRTDSSTWPCPEPSASTL